MLNVIWSSAVLVVKTRNARPEGKKYVIVEIFFFLVVHPAGDRTAGRLELPPRF